MKKYYFFISIILLFIQADNAYSYKILYAEQYYRLYHRHFYQYPNDYLENIHYLEQALRSDFANPLNALSIIKNEQEWERYRNLFRMHVSLKLAELYIGLAGKYDRMEAYFYNAPWKRENLKSLAIAEESYEFARVYWNEAVKWSCEVPFSWTCLEDIQNWEDEAYRIRENKLDYDYIIDRHLTRLAGIKQYFTDMDENTY